MTKSEHWLKAIKVANTTHGLTKTSEYDIWQTMKARCSNPNHNRYARYGGRGIKVCERWLKFENFYKDMGSRPTGRHTIERVNKDGNYEPANCKWATYIEQNNNRVDNIVYEFKGRSMTLPQIAREVGINYNKLWLRINRSGWSLERAVE